jgi:GNAT superfamily N-acetyltransferase
MGYRLEAETMALVCPLTELSLLERVPARGEITTWAHPTETWLETYLECSRSAATDLPVLRELLGRMAAEPRYASLSVAGDPVACAVGVLDEGYLGIFSLATSTGHRRQGHARSMIGHLVSWALDRGAHSAHLQALVGNEPARRLYDRLGFREAYRYWYRVLEG